jgi:ADP-ribosylglycohydrolase
MYGAVIGDNAGSIYEYRQAKQISHIEVGELITSSSFYSDDTIMTIAVLEAMLDDKNFDYYLKKYVKEYSKYSPDCNPYFNTPFSPGIIKWAQGNTIGESIGNGAMMRISPVGYLSDTQEEVMMYSFMATRPSHNSKEAIESATLVAMIIFLARQGYSKKEIIKYLNIEYAYQPFRKFNATCYETLNNCLYALFETNDFEDSLRYVISFGGDTDTNACIVGSMAEALYGIDENLIDRVKKIIPEEFVETLDKGYIRIKKLDNKRG